MFIRCNTKILKNALAHVSKCCAKGSTMPILSNVLLTCDESGGVKIRATDLEMFGMTLFHADETRKGETTVPAKLLLEVVSRFDNEEMRLETDGTVVKIASGFSEFELSAVPADDFPLWEEPEGVSIMVKAGVLQEAIRQTLHAVPTQDPRKILGGILFVLESGTLTLVATDGRKMGKYEIHGVDYSGERLEFVVPAFVCNVVHSSIDDVDVTISTAGKRVAFCYGDTTLSSNLLEGTYPKYESVIPHEVNATVYVDGGKLGSLAAQAATTSENKHNSIVLAIEEGKIRVESQSYDVGKFAGQMEADYDGHAVKVAFNHKYLRETMAIFAKGETVEIRIRNAQSPVLFLGDDSNALQLIMPVRLKDIEEEEKSVEVEEEKEEEPVSC